MASKGGALRQITRVFIENKMAVVGLAFIVFMILFCFVGPLVYHTNQTNSQRSSCSPTAQNAPPGKGIPSGPTPRASTSWAASCSGGRTR